MPTNITSFGAPDDDFMGNVAPIPSLTLRSFVEEAGRAIRQILPQEAWVDAVVLDAKPSRHGFSLELVEPGVDNPANSVLIPTQIAHDSEIYSPTVPI